VKGGEEFVGVVEHLVDLGVGLVGIGSEAVVDAEEEGDDIGRLVVAMLFEVARSDRRRRFCHRRQGR
jgi:hypothetical protein